MRCTLTQKFQMQTKYFIPRTIELNYKISSPIFNKSRNVSSIYIVPIYDLNNNSQISTISLPLYLPLTHMYTHVQMGTYIRFTQNLYRRYTLVSVIAKCTHVCRPAKIPVCRCSATISLRMCLHARVHARRDKGGVGMHRGELVLCGYPYIGGGETRCE